MQEHRESTHIRIDIISHSNELHEAFVEVHDKNGILFCCIYWSTLPHWKHCITELLLRVGLIHCK